MLHDAGDEEAEVWESTHRSVAGFIMPLLNTIDFEGAANVKHLVEAIKFVKRTSSTARNSWGEPPRAFNPKSWLPMIFPEGKTALFVRSKYIVCVAHLLHVTPRVHCTTRSNAVTCSCPNRIGTMILEPGCLRVKLGRR